MHPKQLSHELREEDNADLSRRRWIIGLSVVGSVMAQIVSLYQTGIIRRLPDLPFKIFDANRVDASNYAYRRLQTPDGFMMLVSYAFTALLAAAGGKERVRKTPALPIAMGAKLALDSAFALQLAREEWSENKAFCVYCQIATVCSFISTALALPEVLKAFKKAD